MLNDAQRQHFQVVIKGTLAAAGGDSQQTRNILYYERTSFAVPFDASAFRTAFLAKVQAPWLAATSLVWTFDKLGVRCINSPNEAETESTIGVAGGVVGQALPGYAAMVISKRTSLRGRSWQGRVYVAGVPEDGSDGNGLNVAHKALLDTLASKLLETVTDANNLTFVPIQLSGINSDLTVEPATIAWQPLNQMIARTRLGTMMSRKSKVSS